ncbi:putative phosphate permease [Thelohanellus kitauei]|uniref:Phosphate transporter n=1 Tax=Thelohanellus kitauei TaxID=669202 RepID=A0A0C2N0V5_THEKT|nr:putative phosphate permease [Thelohanellus kitauei]
MSFGMGANDVSNAFGTTYGAKIMTFPQIIVVAGFFEATGALLLGADVADSSNCISMSNTGEVFNHTAPPENTLGCAEMLQLIGALSALTASSVWMFVANFVSLPVSTTHSIVGSLVGYGLVCLKGEGLNYRKLIEIASSWFISPFVAVLYFNRIPLYGVMILSIGLSFICAAIIGAIQIPLLRKRFSRLASCDPNSKVPNNKIKSKDSQADDVFSNQGNELDQSDSKNLDKDKLDTEVQKKSTTGYIEEETRVSEIFKYMQIMVSCYGAFAHGGNDVSNSVAPLMNIWLIVTNRGNEPITYRDMWLIAIGAAGLVLGLAVWGERILITVGKQLTHIYATMAYAIELGSIMTVVGLTRIGIPVSTTHCKIGSLILLGMVRNGVREANYSLIVKILLSWFVTLPVSGGLSALFFYLIRMSIFGTN